MKIGKEEIIAYVKIPIEDKYIIYPIVKFNPEMDSMELINYILYCKNRNKII